MKHGYQYSLEPYTGRRTRHTCPNCGKPHEFTRYLDTQTGQHLADHVGKCNRDTKCGYHYKPSQYFAEHPDRRGQADEWRQSELWQTAYTAPPQQITYLPAKVMQASQQQFERNNLCRYLASLFGWPKTRELAAAYQIGTSKRWQNDEGFAVAFWQIDRAGNIRQCKAMACDPHTGRRIKEPYNQVAFVGKQIAGKDASLAQCFFGEHLLTERPDAPVCIVESEKTAIIAAGYLPRYIWLATGGKNGCRWTDRSVFAALEGRQVILYPDLDAYDVWADKAKLLATVCHVSVSDLLERLATDEERAEGYDLADYLVSQAATATQYDLADQYGLATQYDLDDQEAALPAGWERQANGLLLAADGLPAIWCLCPTDEQEAHAIAAELQRLGLPQSKQAA
jgi:hypothetical protein